jgi:hypothetical protein
MTDSRAELPVPAEPRNACPVDTRLATSRQQRKSVSVPAREFPLASQGRTHGGMMKGKLELQRHAPPGQKEKDFDLADWAIAVQRDLGLTQDEFAERIGFKGRTGVGKWSMGGPDRQNPGRDAIAKIWEIAPAGTPPPPKFGAMVGGQPKGATNVIGLGMAPAGEIARTSDPIGKLLSPGNETPGLRGYLDRHGDDVTPRERRMLGESRFKLESETEQLDDEFWADILAAIRRRNARRPAQPGGGSSL